MIKCLIELDMAHVLMVLHRVPWYPNGSIHIDDLRVVPIARGVPSAKSFSDRSTHYPQEVCHERYLTDDWVHFRILVRGWLRYGR